MKLNILFLLVLIASLPQISLGQSTIDSAAVITTDTTLMGKEYSNLSEALQNPDKVFRLNLSNQNVLMPSDAWSKFVNLEFLSFKNDHLKDIPKEIGLLKNLKVLDLSGNDFTTLPPTFSSLVNLEELFLNDEINFSLSANIEVISLLPRLKILHLENDKLDQLPKEIFKLQGLEVLYLNNNNFEKLPMEIMDLKNLKYLDLHDNKLKPGQKENLLNQPFGIKIKF